MPATVTGSKTVTTDATPFLTAARLTTIFATPIEQLSVRQANELANALATISGGDDPRAIIGDLIN